MQEVFKKGLIAKVCYILRGYVYKKILSVDHLKSILVPLGYMDEDDNISLYELMEKNFGNNRITPESIESFVTFFVGAGVITDGGNKIIIKRRLND
jgi:ABC-type iron transport system FetAB permease component